MRKVVFRADGNAAIGLGHVIRSLALAEMLKDEFYCVFAIQEPSEALRLQISSVCAEVITLLQQTDKAVVVGELDPCLQGDELVILDGYKFDTAYQLHIKSKCSKLVCIDDIHAYHFVADLIINHGTINDRVYSREPCTRLLLGTRYSLLRPAFLQAIQNPASPVEENNVFLCFGGSDALNLTCSYVARIAAVENVDVIHVVVGSAFQHQDALLEIVAKNPVAKIHVHRNISAEALVQLIQQCKVAVVPGSTIAIECASIGIAMLCGYYVDNQHDIVQMLESTGLAINVGDFTSLEPAAFTTALGQLLITGASSIRSKSRQYFDGGIKARFIKTFDQLFNQSRIMLRKAAANDVHVLFQWANDQVVRHNAINQELISFENHMQWFDRKLQSPDSYIYLAALEGEAIGQVRFDLDGHEFLIDYSLSSHVRGKGFAGAMLAKAICRLQQDFRPSLRLKAVVKLSNKASIQVFQTLEFTDTGSAQIKNEDFRVFEKQL